LAREVARQELAAFKAERERTRLADAVRLARVVDLPIAEMERVAGVSRQTIYNAIDATASTARRRQADQSLLQREVLTAIVAKGGAIPIAELASRLNRDPMDLRLAITALEETGVCRVLRAGYADTHTWEALAVAAEPSAEAHLRARFDELFLGRAAAYAVYLVVDTREERQIAAAAEQLISSREHTVIPAGTASVMHGPELAFSVYAASSRAAIAIAADLWQEVRSVAELPTKPAQIIAVIPPTPAPNAESAVLDAFAQAIAENTESDKVAPVLLQREAYSGGQSEKHLAARCLTVAATAMRRSVGQDRDPRLIDDGDAAFGELMSVRPLVVDAKIERIQKPLIAALQLATERLGPIAGGRRGRFQGGAPNIVVDVQPSGQDLIEIATLSGVVVAAADQTESASAVDLIREVLQR